MSDTYLKLIPDQPNFRPSADAQGAAVLLLRNSVPLADAVLAHDFTAVQFIDPGSHFEGVRCPACDVEITDAWRDWMDEGAETAFRDLTITTRCCGVATSLNELAYKWPAGFARFTLEAKNPGLNGWLNRDVQRELEAILGCKLRQVLSHP